MVGLFFLAVIWLGIWWLIGAITRWETSIDFGIRLLFSTIFLVMWLFFGIMSAGGSQNVENSIPTMSSFVYDRLQQLEILPMGFVYLPLIYVDIVRMYFWILFNIHELFLFENEFVLWIFVGMSWATMMIFFWQWAHMFSTTRLYAGIVSVLNPEPEPPAPANAHRYQGLDKLVVEDDTGLPNLWSLTRDHPGQPYSREELENARRHLDAKASKLWYNKLKWW